MTLTVKQTAQFKRDLKLCAKRHYDLNLLTAVVNILRIPAALPAQNRDHTLTGNWAGHQECHIQSDWLLIYRADGNELMLYRTGTHADLFGI